MKEFEIPVIGVISRNSEAAKVIGEALEERGMVSMTVGNVQHLRHCMETLTPDLLVVSEKIFPQLPENAQGIPGIVLGTENSSFGIADASREPVDYISVSDNRPLADVAEDIAESAQSILYINSSKHADFQEPITIGGLSVNPNLDKLTVDGKLVHLRPKVFNTLFYLMQHPDTLVTTGELIDVLGLKSSQDPRISLKRYINKTKISLGSENRKHIETVGEEGYRFISSPQPEEKETV